MSCCSLRLSRLFFALSLCGCLVFAVSFVAAAATVTIGRWDNAPNLDGGNARDFVGQLENALNGRTIPVGEHSSLYDLAVLDLYINSQPTVGRVQAAAEQAAREYTPQGTANSAIMATGNARLAQQIFADKLQAVGLLDTTPASGDAPYGLYFYGQPFFHYGHWTARAAIPTLRKRSTAVPSGC